MKDCGTGRRVSGELCCLSQVRGDPVAAPVTATEPVVVAVIPGRVLVEQRVERREVAAGEGLEDRLDGSYILIGRGAGGHGGLLCWLPGRNAKEARTLRPSIVQSIHGRLA
jgi:hypothetical protein